MAKLLHQAQWGPNRANVSLLRIYNINIEAGLLELLEQNVFSDIVEDAGILHLVQEARSWPAFFSFHRPVWSTHVVFFEMPAHISANSLPYAKVGESLFHLFST